MKQSRIDDAINACHEAEEFPDFVADVIQDLADEVKEAEEKADDLESEKDGEIEELEDQVKQLNSDVSDLRGSNLLTGFDEKRLAPCSSEPPIPSVAESLTHPLDDRYSQWPWK